MHPDLPPHLYRLLPLLHPAMDAPEQHSSRMATRVALRHCPPLRPMGRRSENERARRQELRRWRNPPHHPMRLLQAMQAPLQRRQKERARARAGRPRRGKPIVTQTHPKSARGMPTRPHFHPLPLHRPPAEAPKGQHPTATATATATQPPPRLHRRPRSKKVPTDSREHRLPRLRNSVGTLLRQHESHLAVGQPRPVVVVDPLRLVRTTTKMTTATLHVEAGMRGFVRAIQMRVIIRVEMMAATDGHRGGGLPYPCRDGRAGRTGWTKPSNALQSHLLRRLQEAIAEWIMRSSEPRRDRLRPSSVLPQHRAGHADGAERLRRTPPQVRRAALRRAGMPSSGRWSIWSQSEPTPRVCRRTAEADSNSNSHNIDAGAVRIATGSEVIRRA